MRQSGYNLRPMLRTSTSILLAILAFALTASPASTGQSGEEEPVSKDGSERKEVLREEVTVTANSEGIVMGPRGASTSIVDPSKSGGMPATLTELITTQPGISENGMGGTAQVVSIRGVSRHRVTSMLSGMRLASERRAGVSLSFLDPLLMGSIQIIRGPATSFYGSGALGGVLQVFPRRFDAPHAEAGYSTNGNENYQLAGIGSQRWSVAMARRSAGDGEAADGTPLNSHFTQYSAVLQGNWKHGQWQYELLAVPAYAGDAGKSRNDFPERSTTYPRERHGMLEMAVTAPSGWRLHTYVHAWDLETAKESVTSVVNDSLDFGTRWGRVSEIASGSASLEYGLESFNRRSVDAVSPDQPRSLDNASLDELGTFAAVKGSLGRTSWQAGGRFSWARQLNGNDADRSQSAWNGFAEISGIVAERLELRGSIDSGLRFPSLTELFYTGETARGYVIGNPDLDAERSLNAELSLRWLGKRLYINCVMFGNHVNEYIERIESEPDILSYINLPSGTIVGLELQGLLMPAERWRIFWAGHHIHGRSSSDEPLADIPPDEISVGVRRVLGGWGLESRLAYRDDKSDPGTEEVSIPSACLLSASVSYALSSRWRVDLSGTNLLDEEFYASADRKAPLAVGRSLAVRLSWSGLP